MTEHTPKQIALARKCAAKYWQGSDEPFDQNAAQMILSGKWDDHAYTQAALAAIVEVSELAAEYAERTSGNIAADLRNGDHLP